MSSGFDINIPRSALTWKQYHWFRFAVMIPISFLFLWLLEKFLLDLIWPEHHWDWFEILAFGIIVSAMDAFLAFPHNFRIYYIRRDGIDDLLDFLHSEGYCLAEDSEEKVVLLRKVNMIRYLPAMIYLKEGAIRLEVTKKYGQEVQPFLLEE